MSEQSDTDIHGVVEKAKQSGTKRKRAEKLDEEKQANQEERPRFKKSVGPESSINIQLPLRADITVDEAVTVLQRAECREKIVLEGCKEQTKCERTKLEIAQLQLDTAKCQLKTQQEMTKRVQIELARAETELRTAGVACASQALEVLAVFLRRDAERAAWSQLNAYMDVSVLKQYLDYFETDQAAKSVVGWS